MIRPIHSAQDAEWRRLRQALWPDCTDADHERDMVQFVAAPERYVQLLACSEDGKAIGFVEASIRSDYVNGTESSPVAFLEGLYVEPEHRGRGVARALVAAVAEWARSRGLSELASDVLEENELSQTVHKALGFEETERVVYFRQSLAPR